MNYKEALWWAAGKLKKARIERPESEARLILILAEKFSGAASGKTPTEVEILAHSERVLSAQGAQIFKILVGERVKHAPLAYLAGEKEFYGLNFKVNKWTLIPRPETETLVEVALRVTRVPKMVVDVGTGSGCILISLLKKWTRARGLGIDISKRALKVARENAEINGVAGRMKFLAGSLMRPIERQDGKRKSGKAGGMEPRGRWILTANLPYLDEKRREWYVKNCPEIEFEPARALYAERRGLGLYEKLLRQVAEMKNPPERIFLEIGPEQEGQIKQVVKNLAIYGKGERSSQGTRRGGDRGADRRGARREWKVKIHKDLGGRARVAEIR